MESNDSRYNGQLQHQQLVQLNQQQLEHLHAQQQQQQLHQQQILLQQQQQPLQSHDKPQQLRRRIRGNKQKNNAAHGNQGEEKTDQNVPKKKNIDDDISIEEALKALTLTPEGACSAIKTPVSVLQELLSRRGITPTYDLVQIEGAIHEPTFRYRVTFGSKDG